MKARRARRYARDCARRVVAARRLLKTEDGVYGDEVERGDGREETKIERARATTRGSITP